MSKGEATRQAVLEQATEIAGRLGLAGLTIGSLATTANISKSGLFGHFKSKEALQMQVMEYAREWFITQVVHPALKTPRGEKRVRALFDHWVGITYGHTPGCLFVSAATEFDDQPGPVRDQLVRDHSDLDEMVAQIFRTGIAEGDFRADADAEQFAFELNGLMLGFFQSHRLMRDPLAEERVRRAFDAILDRFR